MKRRSTTATETAATAQAAGATPVVSDRGTLRRGLQLAPEMTRGLGWTLLLALVATTSNVIVPMTIQRAIDDGILAPGGSTSVSCAGRVRSRWSASSSPGCART